MNSSSPSIQLLHERVIANRRRKRWYQMGTIVVFVLVAALVAAWLGRDGVSGRVVSGRLVGNELELLVVRWGKLEIVRVPYTKDDGD